VTAAGAVTGSSARNTSAPRRLMQMFDRHCLSHRMLFVHFVLRRGNARSALSEVHFAPVVELFCFINSRAIYWNIMRSIMLFVGDLDASLGQIGQKSNMRTAPQPAIEELRT